jgi:hypothetical protein
MQNQPLVLRRQFLFWDEDGSIAPTGFFSPLCLRGNLDTSNRSSSVCLHPSIHSPKWWRSVGEFEPHISRHWVPLAWCHIILHCPQPRPHAMSMSHSHSWRYYTTLALVPSTWGLRRIQSCHPRSLYHPSCASLWRFNHGLVFHDTKLRGWRGRMRAKNSSLGTL